MHFYAIVDPEELGKCPRKQLARVTREDFDKIVETVTTSVKKIAYDLSSQIRSRFPLDNLLEAMSIVFPQYWSLNSAADF